MKLNIIALATLITESSFSSCIAKEEPSIPHLDLLRKGQGTTITNRRVTAVRKLRKRLRGLSAKKTSKTTTVEKPKETDNTGIADHNYFLPYFPFTQSSTKRPSEDVAPRDPSLSTKAPSTKAPSTKAPSTKAPSTKAPLTQAPSTKAPSISPKAPEMSSKAPTMTSSMGSTKAPTLSTKVPSSSLSTKSPTINTTDTEAPSKMASTKAPYSSTDAPSLLASAEKTGFPSLPPTQRQTKSPTKIPTLGPTLSPTLSPTSAPSTSESSSSCILRARLGFPDYEDPDDAPFYGYHTDWLEVWFEGAEDEFCDSATSQEWCTYENTNSTSTGAYISNVDDYYYDWASKNDKMQEEIFEIDAVAGKTSTFYVSHWYNKINYYGEYKCWSDHMLAATLEIVNISDGIASIVMDEDGSSGWKHAVSKEVFTHISNGNGKDKDDSVMNPEYEGEFSVLVTCDEECECKAHDYTIVKRVG